MQIKLEQLLGQILLPRQEWFHGQISRQEGERRLKAYANNNNDGLFLVRERINVNNVGSYAISVVFKEQIHHYIIDVDAMGQLSINNGVHFQNLVQVVDHYSRVSDGLLVELGDPCKVNGQTAALQ